MTLETKRRESKPIIPRILQNLLNVSYEAENSKNHSEEIRKWFPLTASLPSHRLIQKNSIQKPLKVGVFFSGGPAAGGHNVLWGLFDALQKLDERSQLIGFLNGPSGLIQNQFKELNASEIHLVRNQGGFDLIGTGRGKIETEDQMETIFRNAQSHHLDGIVVIGGDDSNTNAAHLAEYFLKQKSSLSVVGVPKTIDGDLQSEEIEISFGFDTACKTYSEIIGNICRDARSMKKYTHFIKLMGRSASHIALECALATQPNLTLIGEEKKGLKVIVQEIVELIEKRKEGGKEYGVILIPEGLIEFIPEMRSLIQELNRVGTKWTSLLPEQAAFFSQLPKAIQNQLLLDRDPHGNVKVSQIQTEQLLAALVKKEIPSCNTQEHFLGYEGRSAYPTLFDANYTYALGLSAALAIRDKLTAMIIAITHLKKEPLDWNVKATPLIGMMQMEERQGKRVPVIQKALVDTKRNPFVYFSHIRKSWGIDDAYRYPGPIQFFGDKELIHSPPITLEYL